MNFQLDSVNKVEFYVCHADEESETHYQVPVALDVQKALTEMLAATQSKLEALQAEEAIEVFSPAQKYGANDAVQCQLNSEYAEVPRTLLAEKNVPTTRHAIDDLKKISYYYIIAFDSAGNNLLGVRRASQFKGVLKARLLNVVDNTLKLSTETTFRLDADFDYIADSETLWALRPSGLEFTGKLTEAVKAAALEASAEVAQRISYLNLSKLGTYASKHPRAARYLAAVRSRDDLELISRKLLESYCANANIGLVSEDGKVSPEDGNEILFLEVLDRRLYITELIEGQKERYEAPNRKNI